MKFTLTSYKPIDYRHWHMGEAARQGKNILHLLTKAEQEIWKAAIPYQDARDDPGQGETAVYFALQLLGYYPKAKREVVVPAAIMHDIGWYQTDVNAWKSAVTSGNVEGELRRRPHQIRGVGLAGRILEKVGYPEQYHFPIFDIVGDHDTRLLPPTQGYELETRIVWDADMLWRATLPGVFIYLPDADAPTVLQRWEAALYEVKGPQRDLGREALAISRVELVNTMLCRFPREAPALLQGKYAQELKLVQRFYDGNPPEITQLER